MSEQPIERLNYFNGQRLEAEDLVLEQEYHIRLQRWLSKSLFSPGVAPDGFEVSAVDDPQTQKKTKVLVKPGLALDDLGRAIINVNPVELLPQARYLCIRYAERKERVQEGKCRITVPGGEHLAQWGGPGRIASGAEFLWRREPPLADTRELIIAELKLHADCSVDRILSGPRRLALTAPIARVRALSFEGEKDIDENNAKVIRFHVARMRPTTVTLHLWASELSSLYYTEMAEHNHNAGRGTTEKQSLETGAAKGLDAHVHDLASATASTGIVDANNLRKDDGSHTNHKIDSQVMTDIGGLPKNAFDIGLSIQYGTVLGGPFVRTLTDGNTSTNPNNLTGTDNIGGVNMRVYEGDHHHKLCGKTDGVEETPLPAGRHTHDFEVTTTHSLVGAKGKPARSGNQLSYLSNLQVTLNKKPCAAAILAQIKTTNPSAWAQAGITSLGDGLNSHPLVTAGTGPIRLDLIEGLDFSPDKEHEIRLSVSGDGNGGCIHYNLYVE